MPDNGSGARGRQLRRSRTSNFVMPDVEPQLRRLENQARYAPSRTGRDRAIRQLGRMARHFALAAGTDPLTQLANLTTASDGFDRLMKELLYDGGKRSYPTEAVIAIGIDVEGFKNVNRYYGHTIGDVLLARLAQLLLGSTRCEDVVARVGGDEFLILLPLRAVDLLAYDRTPLTEIATDFTRRFIVACEKYNASIGPDEPKINLHIKAAIITGEGLLGGSASPTFKEVRDACDPKKC